MKLVFVDTNAFLGLYAFADDDLAQLKKLVQHIKNGEIHLVVTDQVRSEFFRNRENKIASTLQAFGSKGEAQFPRLIQYDPQYRELTKAAEKYRSIKKALLDSIQSQIDQRKLPADTTFTEILEAASVVETDGHVIEAAQLRMAIGNPPGKKGSLGDAINWELLLRWASDGADLHVVSQDSDYVSPLSKKKMNAFLAEEWKSRGGGDAKLFETLRDLFKEIAPEIALSPETAEPAANTAPVRRVSPPPRFYGGGITTAYLDRRIILISYDPVAVPTDELVDKVGHIAAMLRPVQRWTVNVQYEGCLSLETSEDYFLLDVSDIKAHLAAIPGVKQVTG